ncbi:SusC/RagA family TonB-linked outer membrane protein [Siphonobacter sp. BAB-5385]|uniref:SusC/RagA family TonB-linked outer membrane protein n=1 Tax=Siphonobacter sp. BAB-5385 TaxID=1864822 RepID=UPI001C3D9BBD
MKKWFTRPPVYLWVVFFLLTGNLAFAQGITGTVTSNDAKQGIPGASVTIKGTNLGTVTNADGQYTLRFEGKTGTLVVSSIGYITQELPVNGQTTLNVTLQPDTKALNEVVVIGYGTARKTDVTGAITSLNARNLDERPVLRVDQALVGQLAGVQVKQTSGALGKGLSVQVRGSGSITAGNEPLYVIDGFPLATAAPNGSGNFATGNPLDNMNPNDIESIQVLKDAAAAAIYGSRAANGVVLITTKRGQSGKSTITVNAYGGYMERSRKLDMLNGPEWIDRATEIINAQWVASGSGRTATQTNAERRTILGLAEGQVNTTYMTDDRWSQPGYPGLQFIDWQDEAFRKGAVQNYQISASGGSENVNYYVSGNYVKQQGMVINTDYTAYSARANVEVKASKNLKIGVNLAPTFSINHDPGVEGKDNILHQLLSYSPVQEASAGLYPNSGSIGQYRWSTSANSPIAKLERVIGETKRFRTLGSLFGEYQLAKGLFWKTTLNLDNTDNTAKGYTPYSVASSLEARNAQQTILTSGSFNTYRKRTFVNENTLSYSKVFAEKHDLSLLGGISYTSDKIELSNMSSNGGFSNNAITTLNAANGITGNTSEARNVLISFFGRAQYSYSGKYLFTASVRQDGSSRFGADTNGAFSLPLP